ncbi:MAG: MBL fold metallo-hydrolase [Myxococcales bacterium]|nr:MBL fold metallo-hydrolase [Myxococcales bacterium]
MKLWALGVGDAFTARYHSTCGAVRAEGATLLVDCPHPIRKVMADARCGFDVGDLCGVVITHLHADHVSGLEGLLFFAHFVLQRRMPVLAHPEVLEAMWDGHLKAGMHQLLQADGSTRELSLQDVAEPVPLSEATATHHGPFTLECRRTIHHIPTFALRIAAAGRTLGWSADTAYDRGLIDWLARADRFVHETNLGVHTPYERLAALPEALRARMWLNHYTDDFDLDASVIEPLRQGHVYEV